MLTYPFDLIYRVGEAEIEIIAVAHHSRRPEYWVGETGVGPSFIEHAVQPQSNEWFGS